MQRISSRSDLGRIIRVLQRQDRQRCSVEHLARHFPRWSRDKLHGLVAAAVLDPDVPVKRSARGVIAYTGSERFGDPQRVGLYLEVKRIIEKHWERKRQYRDVQVEIIGRTTDRSGHEWVCPDLVMHCLPGIGSDGHTRRLVHALEVETAPGFTIRSVYQAHAQGRGADFSWVLFQQRSPTIDEAAERERVVWAARQVGVGLIGFTNSNSYDTWTTFVRPAPRTPSRAERQSFARFVGRSFEKVEP